MHNQIPGGDDDLFINRVATKKNTAIVIDPEAFTYSEPKTSWSSWRRQKIRHYSTSRYYKQAHRVFLSMYAASHMLFYPLLIVSMLLYHLWIPLAIYGFRLLLQGIIAFRTMRKLRENDLFWLYPLLDVWQWFYYLLFADGLFRKPGTQWK